MDGRGGCCRGCPEATYSKVAHSVWQHMLLTCPVCRLVSVMWPTGIATSRQLQLQSRSLQSVSLMPLTAVFELPKFARSASALILRIRSYWACFSALFLSWALIVGPSCCTLSRLQVTFWGFGSALALDSLERAHAIKAAPVGKGFVPTTSSAIELSMVHLIVCPLPRLRPGSKWNCEVF